MTDLDLAALRQAAEADKGAGDGDLSFGTDDFGALVVAPDALLALLDMADRIESLETSLDREKQARDAAFVHAGQEGARAIALEAGWREAFDLGVHHQARTDKAEAALARVKAMHVESMPGEHGSSCRACAVTYPCATIRAIERQDDE